MTTEKTIAGLLSAISELPDGAWIAPGYDVHNVKRILAASGVAAPVKTVLLTDDEIEHEINGEYLGEADDFNGDAMVVTLAEMRRVVRHFATPSQPVAADAPAEVALAALVKAHDDMHEARRACECDEPAPNAEVNYTAARILVESRIHQARAVLAATVEVQGVLPKPGSPEASAMIDSLLAEYQYPSNTKNAARAGWVAASRFLATRPAPAALAGFTGKVDPTLAPDEMSLVQPDLAAKADRAGWVYRSDMALLESGHKVFMYPTSSEPAARAKALPLYTRPAAPLSEVRHAANWTRLTEERLDSYLEDYEMVGESEDGRDACYTPTEGERHLIKDAVMGFLADVDSDDWALRPTPSNERG
jgi:hypothetical protein